MLFGLGSSETAAAGERAAAAAGEITAVAGTANGEAGVTTVPMDGGAVAVESAEWVEIVDGSES